MESDAKEGLAGRTGSVNSWPGGRRHAMPQCEHERWNASHYPGTRQLCSNCGDEAGRCEEDSMLSQEGEPLCEACCYSPNAQRSATPEDGQ